MESTPNQNLEESNMSLEGNEKIKLRILVADDSLDVRNALKGILDERYSSVEFVVNGLDLVKKVSPEDYKCDFIITDNNMPGMNGIDAIKKIRQVEHLKNIPIVMITGENPIEFRF